MEVKSSSSCSTVEADENIILGGCNKENPWDFIEKEILEFQSIVKELESYSGKSSKANENGPSNGTNHLSKPSLEDCPRLKPDGEGSSLTKNQDQQSNCHRQVPESQRNGGIATRLNSSTSETLTVKTTKHVTISSSSLASMPNGTVSQKQLSSKPAPPPKPNLNKPIPPPRSDAGVGMPERKVRGVPSYTTV